MAEDKVNLSGLDLAALRLDLTCGLSEIEGMAFALGESVEHVSSREHLSQALFAIARAARTLQPYADEVESRLLDAAGVVQ